MTVYGDIVFAVNCTVDSLLLLLAARLCGCPLRPLRLFLAAALGGAYAVAVFLPGLGWLSGVFGQGGCFILMAGIAYGFQKRTLRPAAVLLLCAMALAGVVMLLSRTLFPQLAVYGGTVWYPVTARMLLLLAVAFSAAAALLTSGTLRHGAEELVTLSLTLGERTVSLTSLRDTGNTLADPVTGEPVIVISRQAAERLLQTRLEEAELRDPVSALDTLQKACPHTRFRLVPYRAVGVTCGLLLATPCAARIGKSKPTRVLTALSPTPVSETGGYEALMGGSL